MMKQSKGITLVALIITIILLLILAGISILNIVDNGLFKKAENSKQQMQNAQENENLTLLDYENQLQKVLGTRYENPMKDFSINIKTITAISVTIDISKTEDSIKAYVVFLDDDYKLTSTDTNITITDLKGLTNYKITVIAIDSNYNSKKSETTFTTAKDDYLIKEGLTRVDWKEHYHENHTTGLLTFETGYISFKTGNALKYSNYHTVNKVDLTGYSKLILKGKINSQNGSSGHLYISTSESTVAINTENGATNEGLVKYQQIGTDLTTYTIDIQDLPGEYYIGVMGSYRTISIYDIWFE